MICADLNLTIRGAGNHFLSWRFGHAFMLNRKSLNHGILSDNVKNFTNFSCGFRGGLLNNRRYLV